MREENPKKDNAFIELWLKVDPTKMGKKQALDILGIDMKNINQLNKQEIKNRFNALARIYHPDKNKNKNKNQGQGQDREWPTHIMQCLNEALDILLILLKNKNTERLASNFQQQEPKQQEPKQQEPKQQAPKQQHHEQERQTNTNKTKNEKTSDGAFDSAEINDNLIPVIKKGIESLKKSAPQVFTKEFFETYGVGCVPYTALLIKGVGALLEEKKFSELSQYLQGIDKAKGRCVKGFSLDKNKFEDEERELIGNLNVDSTFSFPHIVRLCIIEKLNSFSFREKRNDAFHDLNDSLSNLNMERIKEDPSIKYAKNTLKKIDDSIANKKILKELYESFEKRTKFFKNEKDKDKCALFKDYLAKDLVTEAMIEEVAKTHTGRYTFGLFKTGIGRPTSQKEWEQKKDKYAELRKQFL